MSLGTDGAGRGAGMTFTFEVLVTLKPGLSDPAGKAVEAALPAIGWTNVSGVHVGKHIQLDVEAPDEDDAREQVEEMAHAAALQPRDRGLPDPGDRGEHDGRDGRAPRVGVITFPGSLDDRDALRAVETMGGEPVPFWHADPDLHEVDAVVLPGGFSYGDYLRCGAIAGRADHGRGLGVRRPRRPGARDLQRLPDPLRSGTAPRRADPQPIAAVRLSRRVPAGGDLRRRRSRPSDAGRGRSRSP